MRPAETWKLLYIILCAIIILQGRAEASLPCNVSTSCPSPCQCSIEGNHITVDCYNRSMVLLPQTLPNCGTYSSYTYTLLASSNQLLSLQTEDYFPYLTELDVSFNKINRISGYIFETNAFSLIERLRLNNNRIRILPQSITNTDFSNLQFLSLHKNLWICDCYSTWMKWWLIKWQHLVERSNSVLCNSPEAVSYQSMLFASSTDFTCHEKENEAQQTTTQKDAANVEGKNTGMPMYGIAIIVSFITYCVLGSGIALCISVRKRLKTGVVQNFDNIAMTQNSSTKTLQPRQEIENNVSISMFSQASTWDCSASPQVNSRKITDI